MKRESIPPGSVITQVSLKSETELRSRIARLATAVAFALVIGAFGVGQAHAAHGGGGGGHGGGGGNSHGGGGGGGGYHGGGGSYHGGGYHGGGYHGGGYIITAATGEAAAATGAVAGAIRTTTTDRSRITMAMALSTPIRPFRASPSSLDFDSVAPPDCSVQFEFRTLLARALLSILEHETWRHA